MAILCIRSAGRTAVPRVSQVVVQLAFEGSLKKGCKDSLQRILHFLDGLGLVGVIDCLYNFFTRGRGGFAILFTPFPLLHPPKYGE